MRKESKEIFSIEIRWNGCLVSSSKSGWHKSHLRNRSIFIENHSEASFSTRFEMDRIHIRPRFKSFYVTAGRIVVAWENRNESGVCVGMRRYRSLPNLLRPIERESGKSREENHFSPNKHDVSILPPNE